MKTTLLSLTLFISTLSFSQTIANFTSFPNTNFAVINSGTIDQSPTGMNATWNFSNFTSSSTNTDTYAAPTASQSSTYPGTTQVHTITNSGGATSEFFVKEDGSGNYITGISQGDFILNYNSANAFIGLFPLSYGANNSNAVSGNFTYQGTNGTFTGTATATVEAYGALTITNGIGGNYTGNVTRLRIDQTLSFSIPPLFNNIGTLTQTLYYYYDNTTNNIAIRYNNAHIVSAFLGIDETTESFEQNADITLSNTTISSTALNIYPNPANNVLNIDLTDNQIIKNAKIIDLQGREILNQKEVKSTIAISTLQNGTYILLLEFEKGAKTTKRFIKH